MRVLKHIIFLSLIILSFTFLFSEETKFMHTSGPKICTTWAKALGGGNTDLAYAISKTSDNGFIIGAYTSSYGTCGFSLFLIKINSREEITWNKAYSSDRENILNSITETSDGGFVIAGRYYTYGTGNDRFLVVKFNSSGNIVWSKTYSDNFTDEALFVKEDAQGNLVVVGNTLYSESSSSILILKLNSDGEVIWSKTYGGNNLDHATSFAITQTNEYLITGYSNSFGTGNYDIFLMKIDSNGNLIWCNSYGKEKNDRATSIIKTSDGNFIVAGYTQSFGISGSDFLCMKLNSDGKISWAKIYKGYTNDLAYTVTELPNGNYAIGGNTLSFGGGNKDLLLLGINPQGNILWSKTYGGSDFEGIGKMVGTPDEGILITGWTYTFGQGVVNGTPSILLLKMSQAGDMRDCLFFRECAPTTESISLDIADQPLSTITVTVSSTPISFNAYDTSVGVEDICPTGDINGDGTLDTNDAVILNEYLIENKIDINRWVSDMNGDGKVNIVDIILLILKING